MDREEEIHSVWCSIDSAVISMLLIVVNFALGLIDGERLTLDVPVNRQRHHPLGAAHHERNAHSPRISQVEPVQV